MSVENVTQKLLIAAILAANDAGTALSVFGWNC